MSGDDQATAIQVFYPPEIRGQLARDLEVRAWCEDRGLRVPTPLASNVDDGWVLFEDFGPTDAAAVLEAAPAPQRPSLAARALQPLEVLAALEAESLPAWNLPLDSGRLRWELAGFELWYIRDRRDRRPSGEISRWLDRLAGAVAGHPQRICHRDYHLNNLFLLADGTVGVIDYQDMLVGPESYDAVSLTCERALPRLLSANNRDDLVELWASRTNAGPGWRERLVETELQRGLKVLGTFARLTAAGHHWYESWLQDLERSLISILPQAAAPSELVDILLDL